MSSPFRRYDPNRFGLNLDPNEIFGPQGEQPAYIPRGLSELNAPADAFGPAPEAASAQMQDEPPPPYPAELLRPARKIGFIDAGSAGGRRNYEMDIARERQPLLDKYNADFAAWKYRQDARHLPRHDFRQFDVMQPGPEGATPTRGVMDIYAPNPQFQPLGGVPPRQDTSISDQELFLKDPAAFEKFSRMRGEGAYAGKPLSWADMAAQDPAAYAAAMKARGESAARAGHRSATEYIGQLYSEVYGPKGSQMFLHDQATGKTNAMTALILKLAMRPDPIDPTKPATFDQATADQLKAYLVKDIAGPGTGGGAAPAQSPAGAEAATAPQAAPAGGKRFPNEAAAIAGFRKVKGRDPTRAELARAKAAGWY